MNPVILVDNILTSATLTATSTATGYSVENLKDRRPYTYWKATTNTTQVINIDCGTARTADAMGITGQNLKTASASIKLETSDNSIIWTERLGAFYPSSDRSIMQLFASATARYWRLTIASATVSPEISVVVIGRRLEFPYPPDSGFAPYKESTEEDTTTSKAGHALGTVVRYFPITISPVFSNLLRTWIESTFMPFWNTYGRNRIYHFWAWDLATYPTQVFYVKQTGAFSLPMKVLNYIDKLTLEMKGSAEL